MGVRRAKKNQVAHAWVVGSAVWWCGITAAVAQDGGLPVSPTPGPVEELGGDALDDGDAGIEPNNAGQQNPPPATLDRMPAGDWSRPAKPTKPSQGYLPDAPPEPPPFRMWGPDATPRNFYVGFFLGLGGRGLAAARQTESTSADEFAGQFDARGGVFVDIYEHVRLDISGRVGAGGVNTDVYEDRYRLRDLSSAVYGVEGGVRIFPVQWGAVAPYVGTQGGYSRAEAQLREPTGVLRCETDEDVTVCEEETEVTFSAGWSGRSIQAVGGLRLSRYPDVPFEITFEVAHTWTSWHRYTVTDGGSFNVRDGQRPATRQWGGMLQFAIRL